MRFHYFHKVLLVLILLLWVSCSNSDNEEKQDRNKFTPLEYVELPIRSGSLPQTTDNIPHMQIDVDLVPEINDELIRRIYALPGVEDMPSVVSPWRGIWLSEGLTITAPGSIIGGREFAHLHHDGSLHIFIEPFRASEAIDAGWAVLHPFAVQRLDGYEGFVMLYTPQTQEELDIIFQLIVDGYNYVTSQSVLATDYHD